MRLSLHVHRMNALSGMDFVVARAGISMSLQGRIDSNSGHPGQDALARTTQGPETMPAIRIPSRMQERHRFALQACRSSMPPPVTG